MTPLGTPIRRALIASAALLASMGPSWAEPLSHVTSTERKVLFMELYRVALHADGAMTSVASLYDPGAAKAITMEMLYGGDIPEKHKEKWQSHLMSPLSVENRVRVSSAYEGLEEGDLVSIRYEPGAEETVMTLNGDVLIADPGHELMEAAVDMWFGPSAISEEVREDLIAGL